MGTERLGEDCLRVVGLMERGELDLPHMSYKSRIHCSNRVEHCGEIFES